MKKVMPVLFVGHGSPMNIIDKNAFTESLSSIGRELPVPEAILVVSAHWLTNGTAVSSSPTPKTVYDFYGFPEELYRVPYSCPGSPKHAKAICESSRLHSAISCDDSRGIDHGAWSVLYHMFPSADVPVFQMSLDYHKPPQFHYELAEGLSFLRDQGVLVIGSGNIVHNLRVLDFENRDALPFPWARRFQDAAKTALEEEDFPRLIHYAELPESALAVPTNDHYLPLLYTLGLKRKEDRLRFIYEGIQNASISMMSFMYSNI